MTPHVRTLIGQDRYLVRVDNIVTVLALQNLIKESNKTRNSIGSIIYHQNPLIVFDLKELLWQQESNFYLNSRILIFKKDSCAMFGILFEKVLDMVRLNQDIGSSATSNLSQDIIYEQQLYRQLNITALNSKLFGED